MLRKLVLLVVCIGLLLGASAARAAVPIPPPPARWVTDNIGFLSPEARAALDEKLDRYERETGHQVIVWIGDTIGTEPLDEWATRTFQAWRLGRKGLDDGLALFILAQDRKIAIEVGYGLEDRVPDAIASRIIQEIMVPRIRAGQHDEAVTAAVDALLSAIEGRPFEPGQQPAAPKPQPWSGVVKLILYGAGALALLILFLTHPSLALWLLYVISSGRGNGGTGGGFGGGGGFSGGGGRSGGGGARGSW